MNPVAGFGREAIVGICACGFLAAFGGGTLRDVLQRYLDWYGQWLQ